MEENKNIEKPTYEQLEKYAETLTEHINELYKTIKQLEGEAIFKRLDYLFKVVEMEVSFSANFVDKCIKEIEGFMTVPDPEESENKTETTEE